MEGWERYKSLNYAHLRAKNNLKSSYLNLSASSRETLWLNEYLECPQVPQALHNNKHSSFFLGFDLMPYSMTVSVINPCTVLSVMQEQSFWFAPALASNTVVDEVKCLSVLVSLDRESVQSDIIGTIGNSLWCQILEET
ncbi:hypothetical protein TNCV_118381 [Trichonephila clavipes]|nr:hypothetical protein TNCV_118381 [Trichonephila clavipes]